MPLEFPRLLRSTPQRSFIVYPILVIGFETLWREAFEVPAPYFLPLLPWGYLEYRLVGDYRRRHHAGSRGWGRCLSGCFRAALSGSRAIPCI